MGLEGILEPHYEGLLGSTANNHGLPRFRNCSFHAAYPFGQVLLSDPDVPVDVRIEGFNPLVPADSDASGIPVAVLRFVVRNKTSRSMTAVSITWSGVKISGPSPTLTSAAERLPRLPRFLPEEARACRHRRMAAISSTPRPTGRRPT